ncbi:hypothetical protein Y880_0208102 [Pseudomonas aeruginosa PAK]|nr:hypothetical protein Y880_0208102 [Pseudomonas aeruginosa PAK]
MPRRRMGERTKITRFTGYAVLITTQEGSFQRITLKSSHRVLPSLVDCYVPLAPRGGLAKLSPKGVVAGVTTLARHRCGGGLTGVLTKAFRRVNDRFVIKT